MLFKPLLLGASARYSISGVEAAAHGVPLPPSVEDNILLSRYSFQFKNFTVKAFLRWIFPQNKT